MDSTTKGKLQGIGEAYRKAAEDIDRIYTGAAERAGVSAANGGAFAPTLTEAERAEVNRIRFGLSEEVKGIFGEATAKVRAKVAEPPSAEAASLLQVLSMRRDLAQYDIDAAAEAYGQNYQTAAALASIAKDHNLRFDAPAYGDMLNSLDTMRGSACRCAQGIGGGVHAPEYYADVAQGLADNAVSLIEGAGL